MVFHGKVLVIYQGKVTIAMEGCIIPQWLDDIKPFDPKKVGLRWKDI